MLPIGTHCIHCAMQRLRPRHSSSPFTAAASSVVGGAAGGGAGGTSPPTFLPSIARPSPLTVTSPSTSTRSLAPTPSTTTTPSFTSPSTILTPLPHHPHSSSTLPTPSSHPNPTPASSTRHSSLAKLLNVPWNRTPHRSRQLIVDEEKAAMDAKPQRHREMMQLLYDHPSSGDTGQGGGEGEEGGVRGVRPTPTQVSALPAVASLHQPQRVSISSAPAPAAGAFAVAAKHSKKREWGSSGPLLIPLPPPPPLPSSSLLLPPHSRLDRLLLLESQSRAAYHPITSSASAHAEADRSVLKQTLLEGGVAEAYERMGGMGGGGGGGGGVRKGGRKGSVVDVPGLLDQSPTPVPALKGRKSSVVDGKSRRSSVVGAGQSVAESGRGEVRGVSDSYQPFEWLPDAIVEHHQQQLEANSGSPMMVRRASSTRMLAANGRSRSSVSDIASRIVAM